MNRLIVFGLGLALGNVAFAATHCVSTATEFRNALATAASNNEFDDIRLKPGVYYANSSAPFHITFSEPYGIRISGGWTNFGASACLISFGNATQTVLDGMSSTIVLRIRTTSTHVTVPITVEALTVRHGESLNGGISDGAGLAIEGFANGAPQISVDRIIAESNVATAYAPAVALTSDTQFIRFTNSIVRLNQTQSLGAVTIACNAGGSALHNLTLLFNTRTTPGGALDWLGVAPGQMTGSLVWGNSGGGSADLEPNSRIQYSHNRYETLSGSFGATSFENYQLSFPQLDSMHRPGPGSPLRDTVWGVGTKDVYGAQRRVNGYADIGAAEGL